MEREIVEGLRRHGCTVFVLSDAGAPDLLVGHHGQWTPMEIKAEAGTLTALQVQTLRCVPVVHTLREALGVMRGLR